MNVILFDDPSIRVDLLPFTFTRPVARIRIGILTIDEKWTKQLSVPASFLTENYLQQKFPLSVTQDNLFINGGLCPDEELIKAIEKLPGEHILMKENLILASRNNSIKAFQEQKGKILHYAQPVTIIDKTWKIFGNNAAQIKADFKLLTTGRKSADINDKHTIVYGKENLFLEEGVDIKASIINAEPGPVYLGKNVVIQEGCLIHGSLAMCEGSHLNMGAKMRGDSTIGPFSKVGGEVSNAVIFGYSNKAHDGFLGNSVIGEWCNLGADTNTSNLKNNYDHVKLWSHAQKEFISTGLQFCGLMMGDHSKCSINTMFNTGTVVDVFANIFGEGFPRNYISSFAWGGTHGFTTYQLDKAIETTTRVFARRNLPLSEMEKELLTHLFKITADSRVWENN